MNKTHTNSKYIRNMAALVSLAIAAGTPALSAGQKSGEKEPLARAHLAMPQGAFASPDHPNRSVAQYLEETYRDALEIYRTKAVKDPAYVPKIAQNLIILGTLYHETERLQEAEQAYQEALQIYRALGKRDAGYQMEVVAALNNLGVLYHETRRLEQAEQAFVDALATFHSHVRKDAETPL